VHQHAGAAGTMKGLSSLTSLLRYICFLNFATKCMLTDLVLSGKKEEDEFTNLNGRSSTVQVVAFRGHDISDAHNRALQETRRLNYHESSRPFVHKTPTKPNVIRRQEDEHARSGPENNKMRENGGSRSGNHASMFYPMQDGFDTQVDAPPPKNLYRLFEEVRLTERFQFYHPDVIEYVDDLRQHVDYFNTQASNISLQFREYQAAAGAENSRIERLLGEKNLEIRKLGEDLEQKASEQERILQEQRTKREKSRERHQEERSSLIATHRQERLDDEQELAARISVLQQDHRIELDKEILRFNEYGKKLIEDADTFQPKLDDHFKNSFASLQQMLEQLSKMAKCQLCDRTTLGKIYGNINFCSKAPDKHLRLLLENSLWNVVCTKLFQHPFAVFGDHGDSSFTDWCMIFSKGT
jgi:hypothetical protein